MNPNKKKNTSDVSDEVEELLRAAKDAALLKLSVNSHTVHPSSSDLHPDLEQRFRDLKSGSKSKAKPEALKRKPPTDPCNVKEEVEEDDLLARFSALKASLPKPSPSTFSSFVGTNTTDTSLDNSAGDSLVGQGNVDDDDEDEVEKVIRWAQDAARLDPSPPSDDDCEVATDDDYDDSEKSDEDDDSTQKNKKGQRK